MYNTKTFTRYEINMCYYFSFDGTDCQRMIEAIEPSIIKNILKEKEGNNTNKKNLSKCCILIRARRKNERIYYDILLCINIIVCYNTTKTTIFNLFYIILVYGLFLLDLFCFRHSVVLRVLT